ncbi:MAG: hypothetical protein HY744_17645 [Deltaproteobacteria bacterium]|nr:hypothetical protein [Deltaproteobacteria bacterium]
MNSDWHQAQGTESAAESEPFLSDRSTWALRRGLAAIGAVVALAACVLARVVGQRSA